MTTEKILNHDSSDLHDEHDSQTNNQSNHMNQKNHSADKWDIPSDWEVAELGKITEKIGDGLHGTPEYINCSEYFFINGNNLKDGTIHISEGTKCVSEEEYLKHKKDLKYKSILLSINGTIGSVAFFKNEKIVLGKSAAYINCKDENIDFLFHYLQSKTVINFFEGELTGSTIRNLSLKSIREIPIPLPPLPEQKAIAQVLSTADAAIHTTEKLIAQKELRKKWLMQQLLTGKKRLKGFENTKWHLKSLEEVAEFKNGKAHENTIDENGKYIVVNSKFISTDGKVFKCSNENLCPLFIDDIVMVMSDIPNGKALAKCFYIEENEKYTLNQRICAIRAFKNTDSRFLFFILNRNIHYLSFDNGVGQTNLKKEEVLECPLLIPEKEEQTAIAQVLQAADKEISLLKMKSEKLKEQKKGLMQVLLTGKIRLNYDSSDFYDSNEKN
jgi:type I restriction enzyme S subunit